MDLRRDWPKKYPGDHMDADGCWRNVAGEMIGIRTSNSPSFTIEGCKFHNVGLTTNNTYMISAPFKSEEPKMFDVFELRFSTKCEAEARARQLGPGWHAMMLRGSKLWQLARDA